ncbi:FKBP-type peptidyl-prolyl cis-trans isomerase [Pedobacter insulae]|uniref:Peptidyl-prolyl cis-trans isomerase n=1 Tax=Pedobacter insulae TaxID=414048 RepID=A0A1I2ZCJ5_9SPHI|nr:FKBP-type peptidyl-prolyl cis-trans isomerase [Pedobacter insulae]SFH35582.1 FKBP-type peptidyl-prolyl cis-trans isomerase [Pedobacter insulae]
MQISTTITKYTLALLGMIVLFSSCKKEYESIQSIDDAKIQAYIQKNNITAVKDPNGFYYQILEQGTGGPLLNKDSVFYNYTVTSLNGTSYYAPKAYANDGTYLGYVNPEAYRIALLNINRGGKVRIIIPSYLAFGKNGEGNIPPNEVIISEITVFNETTQWELDDTKINNFMTEKGLTGFTKHPSRVYINTSVAGSGDFVLPASTIKVKYTGRLLNGTVFDQSDEMETPLNNLIKGWQKALIGVTKGSKVRLLIPSDLSYGLNPPSAEIPVSAVLDFDIEILDVVN